MSEVVIHYSATVTTEPDRRYRTLVMLARSDRPTHWKFHCPKCNMPVAELINTEVIALTDVIDMGNINTYGTGVRCDGRFQGSRCNNWYYFTLADAR